MAVPRGPFFALFAVFLSLPALAQSPEDIELRKGKKPSNVSFGAQLVTEINAGLNRDRPTSNFWLWASPQLKFPHALRAQFNFLVNADLLKRMDNYGWYLDDPSLEFACDRIWQEPVTGISFSARARYYIPASKASRQANSRGQLRLYGKTSVSLWRFYLAAEFNGQKYFSKYTTWSTSETPGSRAWFHQAGRDEYLDNNSSYGFGETFTLTFTAVDGLDLSLIYGLVQNRKYSPSSGHAESSGSSYVQKPRWTTWNHKFKFIADVTYGLGSIPGLPQAVKDSPLGGVYLSLGYYTLAPQLEETGKRNLNPFDPKYAQVYFDLTFIY